MLYEYWRVISYEEVHGYSSFEYYTGVSKKLKVSLTFFVSNIWRYDVSFVRKLTRKWLLLAMNSVHPEAFLGEKFGWENVLRTKLYSMRLCHFIKTLEIYNTAEIKLERFNLHNNCSNPSCQWILVSEVGKYYTSHTSVLQ